MDSHTVVIKKYGNRRLYDSTHSRYVNLEEVAQMVREGRDVQVVEAATGEDRTRAVLTQIVVEQAKQDDSAFPLDALRQMIAATGRATNEAALTYMRAALDMYQQAYRTVSPITPPRVPAPSSSGTATAAASGRDVDAEGLRKRIEELESIVSGIRSKGPAQRAKKRKRR